METLEKWQGRLLVAALILFAVGLPLGVGGSIARGSAFRDFKPDPSIKIRTMGDLDALVPHNVAEQVAAGILLAGALLFAAAAIMFPIMDAMMERARSRGKNMSQQPGLTGSVS